jgi:fructoselysine-6-P-deglycase FrlB-like protein
VQVPAIEREIESQPDIWRKAAEVATRIGEALPAPGARLAIVGCGTSLFVAQAIAGLREDTGQGETVALAASEANLDGRYDVVVAVSRSGETTEVARAIEAVPDGTETIAVLGDGESTIAALADRVIALDFADEESIVQTRFATAVLALYRALLGSDVAALADAAERSLRARLPLDPAAFARFVFLGTGWTVGVANEAALKLREAAGAWTESYPAMEYRHGPISASRSKTAVWALGELDPSVLASSTEAGATVVATGQDPMVDLVLIHRLAVHLAKARGLDPGRPAHLSRAVVLQRAVIAESDGAVEE